MNRTSILSPSNVESEGKKVGRALEQGEGPCQSSHGNEFGFSLVEIVIAMMLFAFLAAAILPLILGVTRVTVVNSDTVTAKAAVQQKLSSVRSAYPTDSSVRVDPVLAVGQTRDCSALPIAVPVEEALDNGLTMRMMAGPCPTAFPGSVPVRVWVTNTGGNIVAASFTSVRVTQ